MSSILSMSSNALMLQIDNLNGYDQNFISFKVKKTLRIAKKEKPKPLTVLFHLSQSNLHRGSDYYSALTQIPVTVGIVRAFLAVSVTSHAIGKFREELFKYRYRYIEKVTGNNVLLITINASLFIMFVKEERYIPKIAGPQKLRLGKSIFQGETLMALKFCLSSLFIAADLCFCLLYSFVMSFLLLIRTSRI